jgi:outer membrane protein TolC
MDDPTGNGGLIDLYRIQIEKEDLENNLASLTDQEITLTARFNTLLSRDVDTPVALPDSLIADTLPVPINAMIDTMLLHNPMLGMYHHEKQALEARSKMVSRMGYPMAGLGINYSVINKSEMSTSAMNGKDMVMPMVSFTLPVYRKKYRAMAAETMFLQEATEQKIRATANELTVTGYEAIQNYYDAARRIKLYDSQIRISDKSLDILLKSYASARVGLKEVLTEQRQILNYGIKQAEAVADLNKATAWLKRLGNEEFLYKGAPQSQAE